MARKRFIVSLVSTGGVGMTPMTVQKMKNAIAVAVGVVTTTRTMMTTTGDVVDGGTTKRGRRVDRPAFTLETFLIQ